MAISKMTAINPQIMDRASSFRRNRAARRRRFKQSRNSLAGL
jgi:hypothetical protein